MPRSSAPPWLALLVKDEIAAAPVTARPEREAVREPVHEKITAAGAPGRTSLGFAALTEHDGKAA
jgi:hypothetical protein